MLTSISVSTAREAFDARETRTGAIFPNFRALVIVQEYFWGKFRIRVNLDRAQFARRGVYIQKTFTRRPQGEVFNEFVKRNKCFPFITS